MKRFVPLILGLALVFGLVGTATSVTPVPENLPLALEQQMLLVAAEPGNAAARNDLGNLLLLLGDLPLAEDAYRAAIELAPERPSYRFNLALLLHENGQIKEAADLYLEVLEINPADAWAHYQLGAIRERQGSEKRAIELYGQAFRLDPSLAFPDVNPLVLESDLVTEAMLTGYRKGLVTSRAPRVYNDPGRIARLLVVDPEMQGGEMDEMEPPAGMRAEEPPAENVLGQEPDAPPTDIGAADDRRVLNPGDLSDRPVNQAAPQRGAGYRPPQGSRVRSFRPPSQPQAGDAGRNTARSQPTNRRNNQGQTQGNVIVGGSGPGDNSSAGTPTVGGPTDPRRRRDIQERRPNPIGSTGSLTLELGDAPPSDQAG